MNNIQRDLKQTISLILIILLCQGVCFSSAINLGGSVADSGIQISLGRDSFINLFEGLANSIQKQTWENTFNSTLKVATLQIKNISLAQLLLNKENCIVEFLSDTKIRIILSFQIVHVSFSYKLELFDLLHIEDTGYFSDSNLKLDLDLSIGSNSNRTVQFDITRLDLLQQNLVSHLDNKLFEVFLKLLINFNELMTQIFMSFINSATKTEVNKLCSSIPSQYKIPFSNGVVDLTLQGSPFIQDGYLNIPISGNSYIPGQNLSPLNPFKRFNPQKNGNNSTQIFIDEQVVNRLVSTFIQKQAGFNYTQPTDPSSVTPLDSHSFSAVFPGLRKLKTINYPIMESILRQPSIKYEFKGNKLYANATIGLNLYMREANRQETMFKYNKNEVYAVVGITLNILNDKNFLTGNIAEIGLKNIIVTPEDAHLIDVEQIMIVSPLYSRIVQDSNNYAMYKKYLDLGALLGLNIDSVDINYEDKYIYLQLNM